MLHEGIDKLFDKYAPMTNQTRSNKTDPAIDGASSKRVRKLWNQRNGGVEWRCRQTGLQATPFLRRWAIRVVIRASLLVGSTGAVMIRRHFGL
jgi:hypothetical protein